MGEISQGEILRLQAANAQGIKAVEAGTPGEAIPHYEEALSVFEEPGVLVNLGDALARCGRYAEARARFERAMELAPAYAMAPYNLGVMLEAQGDLAGARDAYQRSAKYHAKGTTLNNLGNALFRLRDLPAAEAAYRAAHKERYEGALWNLSLCLLMQGKYREAWDWYEYRPQRKVIDQFSNRWAGESLEGKSIVVVFEQGLGDCVFAMRYLPELKKQAAKVVCYVDPPMVRLAQALQVGEVVARVEGRQQAFSCDYITMAMSLPGYLSPDSTGPSAPYLEVPAARRASDDFLVGLCWNGSTAIGPPAERDIPLALLKPLSEIEGVKLVSLQQGRAVAELEDCGFEVANPMPGCRDVFATAQVIASLDMVITTDTLIPHLAGALGTPTWLLNRWASCWQWGTPEFQPQLYDTIAQFRQEARGDWRPVVEHITFGLKHVMQARAGAAA